MEFFNRLEGLPRSRAYEARKRSPIHLVTELSCLAD